MIPSVPQLTLPPPPARSNFEGNRAAHIHTTGPEIHAQTAHLPGGLQAFVCATGTGGTLAGVTRALKDLSRGEVQCWLADPPGSVLESWINRGKMERGGSSITEGASLRFASVSCLALVRFSCEADRDRGPLWQGSAKGA